MEESASSVRRPNGTVGNLGISDDLNNLSTSSEQGVRRTMVNVRVMQARDIPFAIKLTDTEDWGFDRRDFVRLLQLDPRGCFLAIHDGNKAGLITTTTYDRFAWVGNVIVARSSRGRGIGVELLNHAISYAKEKGIRKVGLYSYLKTRALYEDSGFVEGERFVRYRGIPKAIKKTKASLFKDEYLKRIARFDRDRFGADRERYLRILGRDFPKFFLFSKEDDRILGYIVAKGGPSGYEIGPWICDSDSPQSVGELLADLLDRMKGKIVEITIPKSNHRAAQMIRDSGFSRVGEVAEMFRGGFPKRKQNTIFAVGGLEKG